MHNEPHFEFTIPESYLVCAVAGMYSTFSWMQGLQAMEQDPPEPSVELAAFDQVHAAISIH